MVARNARRAWALLTVAMLAVVLAVALQLALAWPVVANAATSADVADAQPTAGAGKVVADGGTAGATESATAPGTAQVPVAGTFAYREYGKSDGAQIHGAIHAVVRIPGGTAVFFSIGGPGAVNGVEPSPNLHEDYNRDAFRSVAAIDTKGLKRYQPLNMGSQKCACSTVNQVTDLNGTTTPLVGYAVLPTLPEDVQTVTIEFGFGNLIPNVPVTDTLPQPTAQSSPVVLGHGWPALPSQAQLKTADPAKVTRPLVRHTASKQAAVNERSDSTEVALNSDVLFDTDKATLRSDAKDAVDQVAKKLDAKGSGTVTITGYTDNTGSESHNMTLSKQRAQSVMAALKSRVTKSGLTYTATGKGEGSPVAANDTSDGRQQNRRVTVAFSTNGGK